MTDSPLTPFGENVKTLIEAARKHVSNAKSIYGEPSSYATLLNALAAFEPEPELEYVLPEWETFATKERFPTNDFDYAGLLWIRTKTGEVIYRNIYNALRELTRVPKKPKGREWQMYASNFGLYAPTIDHPANCTVREVIGDTP